MPGIDTNTKLMLHGNRTDGGKPKVITCNGNAKLSTGDFKFGVSSVVFDGTTDYLTIPSTTDFDMGSGDFTYELWIKCAAISIRQRLFARTTASGNDQIYLEYFSDNTFSCSMQTDAGGQVASYGWPSSGTVDLRTTWHHVALVRNSTNLDLYIDGTAQTKSTFTAISTNSMDAGSSAFGIGARPSDGNFSVNGNIDSMRISKGIARYTSNFSVPTGPFVSDQYTVLNILGNGANNATSIPDCAGGDESSLFQGNVDKLVTYNGNAQTDTAQSKFGGSSMLFDGTGDYLSIPTFLGNLGTSSWTFDCQLRFNSLTTNPMLFYEKTDGNNIMEVSYTNAAHTLEFYCQVAGASVVYFTVPFTPSTGTWYHIAVERNGNTWNIYIDGVAGTKSLIAGAYSNSINTTFTGDFFVGSDAAGDDLNGWVDELRWSSTARYGSANFTPPSVEYNQNVTTATLTQAILIG